MPILHKHQRTTYTPIDNEVLRDPNLSWRATGMLAYLLSLPDNWNVNIEDLTRRKTAGRTAARSTMQELKDAGFVVLKESRDEKGHFHKDIHVYETCQAVIDQKSDDSSLFTYDGLTESGAPYSGEADTKKDLEGNTEKEIPKDISLRERNPIWDTISDILGPPSPSQTKLQGRLVARITQADLPNPENEIRLRAERLAAMWGPEKLTLASLEKHWERMGVPLARVTAEMMKQNVRRRELESAMEALE